MLRPVRILLLFIPAVAACSTYAFPPSQAMDDLAAMRRPGYPSFKGTGSAELDQRGGKISGVIHLALEGEKFRMEISHVTGRTLLAAAGDGGRVIRLDPDTGQKEEFRGFIPLAVGSQAPWGLIKTMVTGAPPEFGSIKSTRNEGGVKVVSASAPGIDLYYQDGRLAKVEGGSGPLAYALALGPFMDGPLAPYVASAELSPPGARMKVRWTEVEQGIKFPEGFFTFEDTEQEDGGFTPTPPSPLQGEEKALANP